MKFRSLIVALAVLTLGVTPLSGVGAVQSTANKKCNPLSYGKNYKLAQCKKANLRGSDFFDEWLNGKFQRANFSEANLGSAKLEGNYKRANFTGANLDSADLNARFDGANFIGARFNGTMISGSCRRAKLMNSRLDFRDWSCDFTGANFSGSQINASQFYAPDTLQRANFTGATFFGANFSDTYARDANFTGATFYPTRTTSFDSYLDLENADFSGADFTNTIWKAPETGSPYTFKINRALFSGATWVNVTCPDGSVRNSACWE